MNEDSQVLRKKQLFALASKITRYKNHWLFLSLCRAFNVIPNGLKLKKTAQIGKQSDDFVLQWNDTLVVAENGLTEVLIKEYGLLSSKFEIEFWNGTSVWLASETDYSNVQRNFRELVGYLERINQDLRDRRDKKLSRLIGNRNYKGKESNLWETISFFKDVASFLDRGEEDSEGADQGVVIRNDSLNLDAVRMQLLEDNFENPPPNLLERSRTRGAASNQVEESGDVNNVFSAI